MQQTSKPSNRPEGLLARLRSYMPQRALTAHEAFAVAERQANAFRDLVTIDDDAIDLEHLASLPRIRLVAESDLPVSGAAHWAGGGWLITLNADEPGTRQRYSAFHEFKHILDHPTAALGYRSDDVDQLRERVADYFSACVLMPKLLVKRNWFRGISRPADLARIFDVSERAMRVRLDALGLTDKRRCVRRPLYRRQSAGSATISQIRYERALA